MSKVENKTKIQKNLEIEYEFQQSFLKENKDFISIFKEYLKFNISKGSTETHKLSGNYLYFPEKLVDCGKKSALIVIHELSRTGAPIVALDTALILQENGYFVTVVTLKGGPLLEEFTEKGIPVIIMNDFKGIQYMTLGVEHYRDKLDLDTLIKGFDKIIMITATLYNLVRRYMNDGKKIYWWIHEGWQSYNILNKKMPVNITKNIKVICGGDYSADQLKIYGYNYYPSVLNYGVFDDAKEFSDKKSNGKVKFLMAGTISTRKGQKILLDAIKLLSEEALKRAEFIFIGDPYEGDIDGEKIKEEIEEYVTKNDNVKLYSSVSRKELYKLYQDIDVLVLASNDDPMPVVATENLMMGNIVVCSTHTGTSYYLKDKVNGFVFDTGSVDMLLEKIEYIINNIDKLDEIKLGGRKVFEEYFDMDVFQKNLLDLIEKR